MPPTEANRANEMTCYCDLVTLMKLIVWNSNLIFFLVFMLREVPFVEKNDVPIESL